MLTKEFPLNQKSISLLTTRGITLESIKEQIDESIDLFLELSRAQGLSIIKRQGHYFFETKFTKLKDAEFCIVDIETNGSKIEKHQIIELAALKIKDGKIIDSFESLVYTEEINHHITEITGIKVHDTQDAPQLKEVLTSFRTFLDDAIFVAHDVKFDYSFISQSMQKVGLEPLLNRTLCSLALAERSFSAYRYGLSYLNELLELNPEATHHRAMSDVITTTALFLHSLQECDANINNVEDLIRFSREGKRQKRPKFDPLTL